MCLKVKHKFEGVATPCTTQDAVTWRALLYANIATVGTRAGTARASARVWCITTITRWLVVTLVVLGRLLLRSLQVNYYMENAHFMRAELQKLGLRVYGGENAPYLWVKTPNNTPSWKFFEEMLYGASVVCTPGVGFGPSGEGYIRLTAFGEHEDCKEAMERIAKWLGK